MYEISITTADGQKLDSSTASVAESLAKFKPEFIKGKIVIEAKWKDRTITKVINVPTARRMFYNPLALEIYARNLERALV